MKLTVYFARDEKRFRYKRLKEAVDRTIEREALRIQFLMHKGGPAEIESYQYKALRGVLL